MSNNQCNYAAKAAYLEDQIDRLCALQGNPHSVWQQARGVADLFRTVKPLRSVDRERLWQKYRRTCDAMKQHQAQ